LPEAGRHDTLDGEANNPDDLSPQTDGGKS
jgi:hypothetical protein